MSRATRPRHDWSRRLLAIRELHGWDAGELARRVGLSEATLNRKLADAQVGGNKYTHHAFLQQAADGTGMPVEWFTVDFNRLPELLAAAGVQAPPGGLGQSAQGSA